MKKLSALLMCVVMVFTLCANASAVESVSLGDGDTTDIVYDDYLEERVVTRGENPPSARDVWDFDDGDYDGHVTRVRTGLYTNYCFYPNSKGRLYVDTNLDREVDANGETHSWKVVIGIYDMSEREIIDSKTGSLHTTDGYHKDSFTFSGLDTDTKYCFFISVYDEVCQVTGDVIVSN